MWHWHSRPTIQKNAEYLKVVLVGGQHERCDIRRKHRRIDVHLLPTLEKGSYNCDIKMT